MSNTAAGPAQPRWTRAPPHWETRAAAQLAKHAGRLVRFGVWARKYSNPLGILSELVIPSNDANLSDVVPQDAFERSTVTEFRRGVEEGEDSWKMRQWAMEEIHQHRARKREPEPDRPRPIPIPVDGNVRVDEDENRRCRLLIICFLPTSPTVERREFERQMELQEAGLNAMTPQQMLANRAAYVANPAGMRAISRPLQDRARNEYRTNPRIQQQYIRRHGPIQGPIELERYLASSAALHNPDMVAGGLARSVVDPSLPIENRIGGLSENSSMGSQWINPERNGNTRTSRLTEHARRQARNRCPSVQVDLRMCPSDPNFPGKPVAGT